MTTKKELTQVKELVRFWLAHDENARNSDTYLQYQIFLQTTGCLIPYEAFCQMPKFESIRRCRQLIQNKEHQFKPTDPQIIKERSRRETIVREWLRDDANRKSEIFEFNS